MVMYATDKDKEDYEKMMYDGLDDALIKALGFKSKKAGGPSEKANPPKGRAVALSTT